MGRRIGVLICVLITQVGCPKTDPAKTTHKPLPNQGDASTVDLDAIAPFFDAGIPDAKADSAPMTTEITVAVSHDGAVLPGADVYFSNSTGGMLSRISAGIDGRARTDDARATSASVVWTDQIQYGAVSVTEYQVASWLELPRDRDLLLQIDTGTPPRSPPPPGSVSVTIPGKFPQATEYAVSSCDVGSTTTDPLTAVKTGTPDCTDSAPSPFVAVALDANGHPLAFSTALLPTPDAGTSLVELAMPPWAKPTRQVALHFSNLATRATGGATLQAWLASPGPSSKRLASMGGKISPLPSDLIVAIPDTGASGTALSIGIVGQGGPSTNQVVRSFELIDLLDGHTAGRSYDLLTDVVPSPEGLSIELSNARQPQLRVDSPTGIGSADVMVGILRGRPSFKSPMQGDVWYSWTAVAPAAAPRTFRIPALAGPIADLIAKTPPTDRLAATFDSDALAGYGDLLNLDTYNAVTREGNMPFKQRLSYSWAGQTVP